jgi:hypothetical protein
MIFYPDKFKKKVLPKSFFKENLLDKNLSFKQKAMQALILSTPASKDDLAATVLGVINTYKNKVDELQLEGLPKTQAKFLATNGEALLQQRIENLVVYSEVQRLKEENKGEFYRWLPSGADEPDPEHQLLYGEIFPVGQGDSEGNMPAERYGCQCGMEILTTNENNS